MEPSVQSLCNLLARSKLVPPEEVRSLYQRWTREAGPAVADLDKFTSWLAANQVATEYQIGVVLRGNAEQLFLGQYTVLERVGKGRMAGVYKAIHRLGQLVAIKVLPPSKAKDPKILARFQREARLATRLKHPSIVRTYQAGVAGTLHYLVMEYLEGETLHEVIQRRGKLPPTEAVRIVHQALLGLQHVFEEGLIHRDLKPGNLMVVPGYGPTTAEDTVKIMDIGTGRDLFDDGTTGGADFNLTQTSEVLGTPEYMSPEQARDAHAADVRSDVYSLGCVLYSCLAGRPPFTHSNPVRLLVMHATEPMRPVRELNPAVPDGLHQILEWMLAKDPGGRYPTPLRAAQALEVFLAAGSDRGGQTVDPRLQAYLAWLDAQPQFDVELVEVPAPVAPKAPAPAPGRAAPASVPLAKPVATPPARPRRQTVELDDLEVVPDAVPSAPPAKSAAKEERIAQKPPRSPRKNEAKPVEAEPDEQSSGQGHTRTIILIVAIVLGVLVVGCAGIIGAVLLYFLKT